MCTRWTAAGSNLCSATVCIVGFVWNAEAVMCLVNSSFHPCVVDPITTLLFGQTAVKCFCFIKSSLNPLSQVRLVRLVWAVSKSLTDELTEKNGQREDRVLKAAVKTYSTPTPWSQILSLYCPILFQRFFHIKKNQSFGLVPNTNGGETYTVHLPAVVCLSIEVFPLYIGVFLLILQYIADFTKKKKFISEKS